MKNVLLKIVAPLLAIIAMLAFITLYNPVKESQAAWLEGTQHYACGPWLTVQLIPNTETCNGSNNGNISSYQSSIIVKASAGNQGAYAVHWKWASYFCPTEDPHAPCLQHEVDSTGVGGLTGNNTAFVTAYSPINRPSGQFAGLTCGYYQNDFAFYVTNNNNPSQIICGISLNNPGAHNQNASWCHTGVTCAVPTPTNSPTPTASPTPTNSPTPTATVTPGQIQHQTCQNNACRLVPGPGQNTCSQDSDCEGPTPTPTATPTPTGMPTATPTPGSSCTGDCDNNNNNNNNQQNQDQNQTQNNDQTVNITLNGSQQQQQVLGASTAPTQLPSTGAESDVLFGLLALIPVGWKIRKLI